MDHLYRVSGPEVGDPSIKPTASPWYAFYEQKEISRFRGEIGAAVSHDGGASWQHMGTALREGHHLSYPLVLYHNASGVLRCAGLLPKLRPRIRAALLFHICLWLVALLEM